MGTPPPHWIEKVVFSSVERTEQAAILELDLTGYM